MWLARIAFCLDRCIVIFVFGTTQFQNIFKFSERWHVPKSLCDLVAHSDNDACQIRRGLRCNQRSAALRKQLQFGVQLLPVLALVEHFERAITQLLIHQGLDVCLGDVAAVFASVVDVCRGNLPVLRLAVADHFLCCPCAPIFVNQEQRPEREPEQRVELFDRQHSEALRCGQQNDRKAQPGVSLQIRSRKRRALPLQNLVEHAWHMLAIHMPVLRAAALLLGDESLVILGKNGACH